MMTRGQRQVERAGVVTRAGVGERPSCRHGCIERFARRAEIISLGMVKSQGVVYRVIFVLVRL